MWVQLTRQKQINTRGKPVIYQPGDWVDVGRQTAHGWIAAGEAVLPAERRAEILPGDAGLVLTGGNPAALARIGQTADLLPVRHGVPALPWEFTCIWDGIVGVPPGMIVAGLGLLERWQLAVPVASYDRLACHVGDAEDRERTAAVLPDLRVPVYASGLLFARRCDATRALLAAWAAEPGDRDLAFLRALYAHPLLVLGLPTVWTGRE